MMKTKDVLSKVLDRADEIKIKKQNKKKKIQQISLVSLSLVLIISLSFLMPSFLSDINITPNNPNMGTYFSNSQYLGYIIVGMIAFVLGVVITLICYKIRNDNERK